MRFHFTDTWHQLLLAKLAASPNAQYAQGQTNDLRAYANKDRQQQRALCIVSPSKNAYSQTFVRAHKENLPAEIKSLYAADHNFYDDDGPLVRPSLPGRLTRAALRRCRKLEASHFERLALSRFLEGNRIDAVLAEFGPTATAVMDACKKVRVPLVAHFHGFDAYRRATLETYSQRYQELFQNAAAIIAVSRDMQRQLSELGAPAEKLHYNSCGVDGSVFQGSHPLHNPPTFIAVGRFVNKKAPHLTLLAFKKVVESFPDARLVMIGDGPLWEACHQLARALGIFYAVQFQGPRSHTEVAATMRCARAFVQHSIRTQDGDCEGTPVAVLEASASGLPVIATRHAGIKDAVVDDETGLLVDEGDVDAMAERMLSLVNDAERAARLGSAAREKVLSEYSMEKSINNLWRIIEEAIEKYHAH